MSFLDKIDVDEFTKGVDKVAKEYNISDEEAEKYIMSFGPKRMAKIGILESNHGWREGFTKQTIEKRKSHRKKKNKMAKESRKRNR